MAGQEGGAEFLLQTNLVGACHCLEKARLWGSRFLFLSSSRVYPVARLERHPWQEEATRFAWQDQGTAGLGSQGVQETLDMSGARSLYGCSNTPPNSWSRSTRAAWGLKAVVDRCGVISGPWQFGKADQGVAALWVLAHHFGRPLSYIGYGGQGKQVRDFLHIDDLCELVVEQVRDFDRWDGWCGNVAGGLAHSASLCELTALCQEILGRRVPINSILDNRPWDLRLFIGDVGGCSSGPVGGPGWGCAESCPTWRHGLESTNGSSSIFDRFSFMSSNTTPSELEGPLPQPVWQRDGLPVGGLAGPHSDCFAAWLAEAHAVLDLGCGYGEFINQVAAPATLRHGPESRCPRGSLDGAVRLLAQDCSARWPLPDKSWTWRLHQ